MIVPVVQQPCLLLYVEPFLVAQYHPRAMDSMPGLQIPGDIEQIVYRVAEKFLVMVHKNPRNLWQYS